jgi:oligopeptide/dipeptide ABC transporter ATP-binding protein
LVLCLQRKALHENPHANRRDELDAGGGALELRREEVLGLVAGQAVMRSECRHLKSTYDVQIDTRALLDSVPRSQLDAEGLLADLHPIQGELPSPLAPPAGCHFHQRCPLALDDSRSVACHRSDIT